MAHILGEFDVQVDGNHQFEEGITEIDVYPVSIDGEGFRTTDTLKAIASTKIASNGYADDCWYDMPNSLADVVTLPKHVSDAVEMAVAVAKSLQLESAVTTHKYAVGDTVFLPEYRYPGEVRHLTVDGGYVIDMASTGELAEFGESELEDYKPELWHRP